MSSVSLVLIGVFLTLVGFHLEPNKRIVADVPEVISAYAPIYPEGARDARAEGTVRVEITISKEGSVVSATFLNGNRLFSTTVENAAKKWVFNRSSKDDERKAIISFEFVLLATESIEDEGFTFWMPDRVIIKRKAVIVHQVLSK